MVVAAEGDLDPATLEYLLSHDNPAHVAASSWTSECLCSQCMCRTSPRCRG